MIVGGLAVVVASFTITLKTLDYLGYQRSLCPKGKVAVLAPPYTKVDGMSFAYIANLPEFAQWGDTEQSPASSPTVLCEGEVRMGPPHTLHKVIGSLGQGRFSHVTGGVLFSARDNSDPRSNGKQYTAVLPEGTK